MSQRVLQAALLLAGALTIGFAGLTALPASASAATDVTPAPQPQPSAPDTDASAAKKGLVKEGGQLCFYVKGVKLCSSWKTVNGAKYYFDAKGNAVRGKSAKIKKTYYVFGNNGKLLSPKKACYKTLSGGIYHVGKGGKVAKTGWTLNSSKLRYVAKDGKCAAGKKVQGIKLEKTGIAKNDAYTRLKIFCMKRVAKYTTKSMSTKQKLWRLWVYGEGSHNFVNSTEPKDVGTNGWMQRCAYKVAYSNKIECFGCATLFAALAYEIGCKPVVHAYPLIHAYVEIDGRYYDNMIATVGASAPQSDMRWFPTYKMSSWRDTTNNHKDAASKKAAKSKKSGLVKSGSGWCYYKNGRKLTNKWVTVKGRRYYFKKNGRAATGSYGITNASGKVKYYVFSAKGRLLTGEAVRMVKVNGVKYRVAANGRAASGWNDDKTRCYLANGTLACGVHVVKGELYAASSAGVYDAELTQQLRDAAQVNASPAALLALMGEPLSTKTQASCYYYNDITGTDRVYEYEHVRLYALLDTATGDEYFYSAEER